MRDGLPVTPLRSFEEMIALGLDDCGLPLDGHPALPKTKRFEEGRPCGKSAAERAPRVVSAAMNRWNGSVAPRAEIAPFR